MSDAPPDPDEPTDRTRASRTAALLGDVEGARRYLALAALAVLGLFAVIATFQFYTNVTAVINTWIAPDFRPVFRAAFNLFVLLFALAGIGLLLRELRE